LIQAGGALLSGKRFPFLEPFKSQASHGVEVGRRILHHWGREAAAGGDGVPVVRQGLPADRGIENQRQWQYSPARSFLVARMSGLARERVWLGNGRGGVIFSSKHAQTGMSASAWGFSLRGAADFG